MNLIAFDLGGSGGKLLSGRFDGSRLTLRAVHRFENAPILMGEGLYWDIFAVYREMCRGLRAAAPEGIDSFGIDSFSNDFGLVDRGGELLTPVRCYRDGRTARYRAQMHSRMSAESLYRRTGNQDAPFNTLAQLAAMEEAGQGWLLEHAHRLLFVPDLLLSFLCGGEQASEYTVSSVSQMYSFSQGDWDSEILEAFRIPRGLLGPVAAPGTEAGYASAGFCRENGIAGFSAVHVCEHDTASAFLASAVEGPRAVISSGTWALVGTEVPGPVIGETGMRWNVANEGGWRGCHRLLKNVMGMWLIQEIRSGLRARGIDTDYAGIEAAARGAEPFAHTIDVDDPVFFPPGDMEGRIRSCAGRFGSAPETLGALARCVYEGLAFKYRRAVEQVETVAGMSLPVINIIGGGARDALLCQMTADACGRPVAAGPVEATALGNLLVQLMAKDELSSIRQGREMIAASFPVQWYEPRETGRWEEAYHVFLDRLDAVREAAAERS